MILNTIPSKTLFYVDVGNTSATEIHEMMETFQKQKEEQKMSIPAKTVLGFSNQDIKKMFTMAVEQSLVKKEPVLELGKQEVDWKKEYEALLDAFVNLSTKESEKDGKLKAKDVTIKNLEATLDGEVNRKNELSDRTSFLCGVIEDRDLTITELYDTSNTRSLDLSHAQEELHNLNLKRDRLLRICSNVHNMAKGHIENAPVLEKGSADRCNVFNVVETLRHEYEELKKQHALSVEENDKLVDELNATIHFNRKQEEDEAFIIALEDELHVAKEDSQQWEAVYSVIYKDYVELYDKYNMLVEHSTGILESLKYINDLGQ